MADLESDLLELLRPLVRAAVREEVENVKSHFRWASVRTAATLLDLSEQAVRMRVWRGQIPARKLDGKLYIDLRALDHQLEALPCPETRKEKPRRRSSRPGA